MALPKYTTRKGAASGEASMLWIGKSGRYYRTVVHAKTDKAANAIAGAPNTGKRPPVTPETKPETNNVFFYLIAILSILILIKIMK